MVKTRNLRGQLSCVRRPAEDEDDTTSSVDEEGEHNAWNLFLDVAAQDSLGMLVERFLEDEELARTALSCHLSLESWTA